MYPISNLVKLSPKFLFNHYHFLLEMQMSVWYCVVPEWRTTYNAHILPLLWEFEVKKGQYLGSQTKRTDNQAKA